MFGKFEEMAPKIVVSDNDTIRRKLLEQNL